MLAKYQRRLIVFISGVADIARKLNLWRKPYKNNRNLETETGVISRKRSATFRSERCKSHLLPEAAYACLHFFNIGRAVILNNWVVVRCEQPSWQCLKGSRSWECKCRRFVEHRKQQTTCFIRTRNKNESLSCWRPTKYFSAGKGCILLCDLEKNSEGNISKQGS